ncbi:MAG: hypothetical protein WCW77_01695 [Patescibacteria group bacterium]|jgi:hypothetical protein
MLENNNFDKELLDSIKDKKISPIPRWHFVFRELAIWIAGLALLLVGAFSFSLMIFFSQFSEWGVYQRLGRWPLQYLFIALPVFWLALLISLTFLVFYDFKRTKKGYRYPVLVIIGGAVILSAGLGAAFHKFGLAEEMDDLISQNTPYGFYGGVINPHLGFWSHPEDGRLIGLVLGEEKADVYDVIDIRRKEWRLFTQGAKNDWGVEIMIGRPIRVIGEEISGEEFKAIEILPLNSGRGIFRGFPKEGMLMPPGPRGMEGFRELDERFEE